MTEITMEMEGDVHVIKNVTGTKQLREFYNQVVKNNWEKYVGITTQGIRYGFSSDKNSAVRLPDGQLFAYNPNYRASKVTPSEKTAIQEETVAQEEAKISDIAIKQEQTMVEDSYVQEEQSSESSLEIPEDTYEIPSESDNTDIEVDYKNLYTLEQNKCSELQKYISELREALRTQAERASYAEKQLTSMMQLKVTHEGIVTELKNEISSKDEELKSLREKVKTYESEVKPSTSAETLSTDALMKLLTDKGYKVTISR